MFRHWFKKNKRDDLSAPSSNLTIPNEIEWFELKQKWEISESNQSPLKQILIEEEKKSFERVKGTLEEALSLLDDACFETKGMLKVRLQQIWSELDELVKSYTHE
ncbi:hypothetical protein ABDI30_22590 [Paenibacillus cisolokensis]|uniref:hypothetical protein n=1 Tax=Paenibacillus cisolokensis TaxID=1658519 RepID=UPI003D2B847A